LPFKTGMKLALSVMLASVTTRIVWGSPVVADSLWFAAAIQLSWLFHNDMGLRRGSLRELTAATVRA
jgi:hypothetical protein